MVEKPYACKGHGDVVFVASGDNMVVANRTTCLRNEVDTAFIGTFDVVAEGEECVGAEGDAADGF